MKKIPLLSNIFFKSRSTKGELETDSVPIEDPSPEQQIVTQNNVDTNTTTNSSDFNTAVQLYRQMGEGPDLAMVPANSNTEIVQSPSGNSTAITNNQMAVHNTQGQVVMQFSNISGLHFGSVYNFSGDSAQQPGNETSAARNKRPPRTKTVEAMMRSSDELNHRMLDTISTHLGEGWRTVMRDLNFTQGQIDQAVIDHHIHGGLKEVIYQLLLAWINDAEDGEATLGHVTQLLWKSNHRECVLKMKEVWRQDYVTKSP